MISRNTTKMVEHKLLLFATVRIFVDPCNCINKALSHTLKVEIHTRPKLYHFGRYLVKTKLFCKKCFVPVTWLECSYGKIFITVTEISVTGPARPLIWTHWYFYKEKSGEGRSRKPSKSGWPGSYEEALRELNCSWSITEKLAKDRQRWKDFVAALCATYTWWAVSK